MEYANLEHWAEQLSAKLSNIEEAVDALAARQPELRDLMAMAALPGIMGRPEFVMLNGVAKKAYYIADSMLEERKGKP